MNAFNKNKLITEDYQSWIEYPTYRWVFNKLELALKLGYHAGPACTPISQAGYYIIRPIYNLYGMGIGAQKIWLDPEFDNNKLLEHHYCDPGTFWCEYLSGQHWSIDYLRIGDSWIPFCAIIGEHRSEELDLVRFSSWTKLPVPEFAYDLPDFLQKIEDVPYLNVESKGESIFEVHLRSGNHEMWDLEDGSVLEPIWSDDDSKEPQGRTFVSNTFDHAHLYNARGLLRVYRLGYYLRTSTT